MWWFQPVESLESPIARYQNVLGSTTSDIVVTISACYRRRHATCGLGPLKEHDHDNSERGIQAALRSLVVVVLHVGARRRDYGLHSARGGRRARLPGRVREDEAQHQG